MSVLSFQDDYFKPKRNHLNTFDHERILRLVTSNRIVDKGETHDTSILPDRDGRFGSKVGQIGPQIGQIRIFFRSDFSAIWTEESKCTEKSSRFFPFGANPTHFISNCENLDSSRHAE